MKTDNNEIEKMIGDLKDLLRIDKNDIVFFVLFSFIGGYLVAALGIFFGNAIFGSGELPFSAYFLVGILSGIAAIIFTIGMIRSRASEISKEEYAEMAEWFEQYPELMDKIFCEIGGENGVSRIAFDNIKKIIEEQKAFEIKKKIQNSSSTDENEKAK